MKNIWTLAFACMMVAFCASCSKDDSPIEGGQEPPANPGTQIAEKEYAFKGYFEFDSRVEATETDSAIVMTAFKNASISLENYSLELKAKDDEAAKALLKDKMQSLLKALQESPTDAYLSVGARGGEKKMLSASTDAPSWFEMAMGTPSNDEDPENAALWKYQMYIQKANATKITFETGVNQNTLNGYPANKPLAYQKLNDGGTLWAVYDTNSKELKVQTSKASILAFNSVPKTPSSGMFYQYKYVTAINDIHKVDMSQLTSTSRMFYGCEALTSIDLSSFNTSNVTNMDYMFSGCQKVPSLDLTPFNTDKLTSMKQMFASCKILTTLTLPDSFNTANVDNMQYLFYNCSELTQDALDLTKFNTANVTDMQDMFLGCLKMTELVFPESFRTDNVTTMNSMFKGCENLQRVVFPATLNTQKLQFTSHMFDGCTALTDPGLKDFNTANMAKIDYMFKGCTALEALEFPAQFTTAKVTNMEYMFEDCTALTTLNLASFNNTGKQNTSGMFRNCEKLQKLTLGNQFKVSDSMTFKKDMFATGGTNLSVYGVTDAAIQTGLTTGTGWDAAKMQFTE